MSNIKVFEDKKIRTQWNAEEEDWYFSVVDVIEALTDSVDPTAYWRKLKQRLKDEGNETVTNCHALKMLAKDGRSRLTDVVNTKDLLQVKRQNHLKCGWHKLEVKDLTKLPTHKKPLTEQLKLIDKKAIQKNG